MRSHPQKFTTQVWGQGVGNFIYSGKFPSLSLCSYGYRVDFVSVEQLNRLGMPPILCDVLFNIALHAFRPMIGLPFNIDGSFYK